MEIFPIQTRIMRPPKDDLYAVLDESLSEVREGDVLLVSSKIMAIHQGRCIHTNEANRDDLIDREAEKAYQYYNTAVGRKFRLTLKGNTLISAGGIDESNGDGHYVLWPENVFGFCKEIREYVCKKFGIKNLAVIAVDSHSLPLRYGAMGVSIGFYGMRPLRHYKGKEDLFGREFEVERSNLVDELAAAGTLVMGEGSECKPLAIVRGLSALEFVDRDTSKELLVPIEEDVYWPFLKVLDDNN